MLGKALVSVGIAASMLLVACGGGSGGGGGSSKTFSVSSQGIPNGGKVPVKYTCDAPNTTGVSPDMSWSNPPDGAKSFAVAVLDSSVTDPQDQNNQVPFVHWIVINIPTNMTSLPENYQPSGNIISLPNSWSAVFGGLVTQYIGPCPPKGDPAHTYKFCVAALNKTINPNNYQTRLDLYAAVEQAIIKEICITATYQR